MTLRQALNQARTALITNSIAEAPLEAELLLRHTLDINRVQLYIDLDCELSPDAEQTYRQLIERRISGEPSAYITGHREFYGLDFYLEPYVFIPRPETELLVEKALELAQTRILGIVTEIGTGSGAIAVTLSLNLPQAKVYASDISETALKVAAINCQKYGVTNRVSLLSGDLLSPFPEPADLIIANLPYVAERELPNAMKFEPYLALNGGADGLMKIHQLCQQLDDKLKSGGCLLLEIGQGQAEPVTTLLNDRFPDNVIELSSDLNGIERVVSMLTPLE